MTNTNNIKTKKGFTMIELIFVIVIIGILAAVAIPRLAATRDDAKIVSELASGTQIIQNLAAEYTAQGGFVNYTIAQANAETDCFTFAEGTDGNVSVKMITTAACGQTQVLAALKLKAEANGLTDKDGKIKYHIFGGSGVKF
jgi:general secretion pathway protein G